MVSVTKFFLIYQPQPDMDYESFCKRMRDIQYQVRQYKNRASSEYFLYMMKKNDGMEPPDLYGLAKSCMPYCNTGNISYNVQDMMKRFKTDWKDILSGKKSIPSYKSNQPIALHKNSIYLYEENGKYYVRLSVFSRDGVREYSLKDGMCNFEIWHKCRGSIPIVERCLSGEYQHCGSELKYDNDKKMWSLSLTYKFDNKQENLIQDRIMGIDLGIRVPIAAAISGSKKKYRVGSDEIEKFRAKTEQMRKELSKSRVVSGIGSSGHGRDTKMAPVDRIANRIANFRNTKNHSYSKWIVNIAVKNKCGVIQMEDLSGISSGKKEKFLKDWSYFDLQQKIEYKAKAHGIKVIYVDPKFTSQRCSCCGYISPNNRVARDKFVCERCGFEAHADDNSACNIAIKNIDKVIENSVK